MNETDCSNVTQITGILYTSTQIEHHVLQFDQKNNSICLYENWGTSKGLLLCDTITEISQPKYHTRSSYIA